MNPDPKILKTTYSRRIFLSRSIRAGLLLSLPLYDSCGVKRELHTLSDMNREILLDVLNYLWPEEGGNPSVGNTGMYDFFLWVLSDPDYDIEEKDYLLKGIAWVDETAIEDSGKHFNKLSKTSRNELLEKVKDLDWGDSWYSKIINTIFEALFADPIYGSNTGGITYKWLDHNPGFPRPDDTNKYQALLKRKENTETIKNIEQLAKK
ncbi:MAG: gluconate 2-dehydrogenase subunit 3 family protein [Deltaproteobacteria bacterium]